MSCLARICKCHGRISSLERVHEPPEGHAVGIRQISMNQHLCCNIPFPGLQHAKFRIIMAQRDTQQTGLMEIITFSMTHSDPAYNAPTAPNPFAYDLQHSQHRSPPGRQPSYHSISSVRRLLSCTSAILQQQEPRAQGARYGHEASLFALRGHCNMWQ